MLFIDSDFCLSLYFAAERRLLWRKGCNLLQSRLPPSGTERPLLSAKQTAPQFPLGERGSPLTPLTPLWGEGEGERNADSPPSGTEKRSGDQSFCEKKQSLMLFFFSKKILPQRFSKGELWLLSPCQRQGVSRPFWKTKGVEKAVQGGSAPLSPLFFGFSKKQCSLKEEPLVFSKPKFSFGKPLERQESRKNFLNIERSILEI
jgi:hypothetical protein